MAASPPPSRLHRAVDPARDHVLGNPRAELTLVEYGSYTCPYCHIAHEVIAGLRDRFGTRMRYVFRHLPITGNGAEEAAAMVEYAALTGGEFWPLHDALMKHGPEFAPGQIAAIGAEFGVPSAAEADLPTWEEAKRRVDEDWRGAKATGASVTPTFFINGRRYDGPWDEASLAEAMLGSLGHRLHAATVDFARWAPSTGLLLLVATALALAVVNSPLGPAFMAFWQAPFGLRLGNGAFMMSLQDWVDEGLLSFFFLVVGLEIKREFTVGRLATRRAAALPVAASIGGMIVPAAIYLAILPHGPYSHGWGIPIATDTAFAVALIVLLGERVPVELRVFLTAAVVVDDLVAIVVVAVFYSSHIVVADLMLAGAVVLVLVGFNRAGIYRALPYGVAGIVLWLLLLGAGLHATLAGVILAVVTPTRSPPNLRGLLAQAQTVMQAEIAQAEGGVLRRGPSERTLIALDAIHGRIEAPADKLLRAVEPWSSYVVLPLFALANAGVALSPGLLHGHGALMAAIVLGLVVGKPVGIVAAAALAVALGLAVKPDGYSWRQMAGVGAIAGIGFTMSLFIAGQALPESDDFAAAKVAVFAASLIAGALGTMMLRRSAAKRVDEE
jgi:NhaA family Na+:H+ antiporter